jgi:hypothetical protein
MPYLWLIPFFTPEFCFNPQLILTHNHTTNVVTQELAVHLIAHRYIGQAPNVIQELPFYHAEDAFHVTTLVIVFQEILTMKPVIVMHLLPNCIHLSHASTRPAIALKRHVRNST